MTGRRGNAVTRPRDRRARLAAAILGVIAIGGAAMLFTGPRALTTTPEASASLRSRTPAPPDPSRGARGSEPAGSGAIAGQRPFEPPVTTQSVSVPSSIDATGESDASDALNEWIRSLPDGTRIEFRGGTYRLDSGIAIAGRSDLVFEGQRATLRLRGDPGDVRTSGFYVDEFNRDIAIRSFEIAGNSDSPGVYQEGAEYQHGIAIRGSRRVEITDVTIAGVGGDGVYVAAEANDVWLHGSRIDSAGRMGIAITNGWDVLVEENTIGRVGYGVFDIEPNEPDQTAENVRFLNNRADAISLRGPNAFFFGANGAEGSVVRNVVVSGNTIANDPLTTYVNATPRQDIVFTNNRSGVRAAGPVLHFRYVEGLTLSGNEQPLWSGELADIRDSTLEAE